MNYEYDNFTKNNALIKKETLITVKLCISMVFSVITFALISYYFSGSNGSSIFDISKKDLNMILNILNIMAIIIVIIVLAVRKTIYYSPKFIKDDFTLIQILRKWKSIDITLAVIAEFISIMGLVISLLGMPFSRTFHFFVTSALVILIIMPINWKVRDKLRILNSERDMNVKF